MATLATVQDYVTAVRTLLQDQTVPYRYDDASVLLAINTTMLEIRRVRPDLFMTLAATPSFSSIDNSSVPVDEQYRMAAVYFTCGFVQLRDEEFTQDARAAAFLAAGKAQLTSL